MVGITVGENESIDKALRRFKKKYERSGVLKEFKKRTFFVKPSIKRRMERLKAARRAHRTDSMEVKILNPVSTGFFLIYFN